MAIANGIFKQLLMIPESSLGTLVVDDGRALPTGGTPITVSTAAVAGVDEVSAAYGTSPTGSTVIPKGTKVSFSNNTSRFYFTTADVTVSGTAAFTLPLDAALALAVTTSTTVTLDYTAKNVIPRKLRRVTSNIDLKKATFQSNEIRSDAQVADFRHGGISVEGTLSGELSGHTYRDLIGAVMRRDFTSGAVTTAGVVQSGPYTTAGAITPAPIVITGVSDGTADGTAVKLTFANMTDLGVIKTGDVFWFQSGTNVPANNLNIPLLVIDKDTTSLTIVPVQKPATWTQWTSTTAITAGAKVEVLGEKTFIPLTGHTKKSFAFEHFYSDISPVTGTPTIPASELFVGVRPTQMSIKLPATGLATIDFTMMGVQMKTPSDYTTGGWTGSNSMLQNITGDSPLDSGIDPLYSASVGAIYMKDKPTSLPQKVGLITAFDFSVNGNGSKADVVGSDKTPDVFLGKLNVTGNMSIYFQDTTWRDVFYKEQEASLIAVFTSNSVGDASTKFMTVVMPRIKTGGASKDDGDKALILTVPFTALLGDGTGGFEATTLQIQDFS